MSFARFLGVSKARSASHNFCMQNVREEVPPFHLGRGRGWVVCATRTIRLGTPAIRQKDHRHSTTLCDRLATPPRKHSFAAVKVIPLCNELTFHQTYYCCNGLRMHSRNSIGVTKRIQQHHNQKNSTKGRRCQWANKFLGYYAFL